VKARQHAAVDAVADRVIAQAGRGQLARRDHAVLAGGNRENATIARVSGACGVVSRVGDGNASGAGGRVTDVGISRHTRTVARRRTRPAVRSSFVTDAS